VLRRFLLLVVLLSCAACDAVLGLSKFTFDGSVADASDECTGPGGCYACTPTTNDQFLNSCGGGQCIGFDPARVAPFLTADGGLPPLPPIDSGADATSDASDGAVAADAGGD